jgi:tetratricopeptide (TPR) repeat protein
VAASRSTFTTGYTAQDVSRLLGLKVAEIRSFVRAGFLDPRRGPRGEYRFTFQDLVLLRTAKGLADQIPPRKLKRALRRIRERLPPGRPLTGVHIAAEGHDVVVRDGGAVWHVETGQGAFDFDLEVASLAAKVAPLARRAAREAARAEPELGPDDWFELACDLEAAAPEQARDAYRRALELDPHHPDARVNLGRLLHEAGHAAAAETHYRIALASDPDDVVAAFNLGVALEDLGRTPEAIRSYERALAVDPAFADAHYNLARLYEREGKTTAALRHLREYRALTRIR